VRASKGDKGDAGDSPLRPPTRNNADGVKVWTIGTFAGKSSLMYRLNVERPGPNHIHLRAFTPKLCNGFDAEYFAQFGAEERKLVRVEGTAVYKPRFVQTRARNEAIDLHVLADSAFRALGTSVAAMMPEWVEVARQPPEPEPEPDTKPPPPETDGGWATGGGRWGSW
jgi:phage terminase large subunit GpA-like protein